MRIWLVLVLAVMSFAVFAAGDKNRTQNPVITDDGCVYMVPEGIDDEKCSELVANEDHSLSMLLCDAVVICPEED